MGVLAEVEGVVRAAEGGFDVAQDCVDGGELGVGRSSRPLPATCSSCRMHVLWTALKQPRPSETSVAGAASEAAANSVIDSLANGRLDRHIFIAMQHKRTILKYGLGCHTLT